MRYFIITLFCSFSLAASSQDPKPPFDGHAWKAPYHLPALENWGIERFQIPISFAPGIPYNGVEDIRFTPGWAKIKTDEYWTYAFLWYLDGTVSMDPEIIAGNLKAYYTGLAKVNMDSAAASKLPPVVTFFKKTVTAKGDLETYTGTIEMTDYMQRKPITLNCIVHLKLCEETNKTIVFHELSPKPFTHSNWQALNRLWTEFRCKKSIP